MTDDTKKYGEWRPVPGFDPSIVMVSSEGWIRTRNGLPKKGSYSSAFKVYRVAITNGDMKLKHYLVHRLVAFAFLGPPPSETHTVDHLNRNSEDNRACNLRWATRSEQNYNQKKRKRQSTAKQVMLTAPDGTQTYYKSSMEAGLAIGANPGNISNSAHKGWIVNGYKAEYVPTEDQGDIVVDGETERWSVVADEPNLSVSTMGRIQWNHFSVTGFKITPVPKQRLGGYCIVKIGDSHGMIHDVVLRTFVGPPPNDDQVYTADHINHIRHDNRLSNLRWATKQEQRMNQTTAKYVVDESNDQRRPSPEELAPPSSSLSNDVNFALSDQVYRRPGKKFDWSLAIVDGQRKWVKRANYEGRRKWVDTEVWDKPSVVNTRDEFETEIIGKSELTSTDLSKWVSYKY